MRVGYTHYWYRPRTISDNLFTAIRTDFEKLILPLSDAGVELAGGLGEGPPEITGEQIWFNGLNQCGHPRNDDLVIPYPSSDAQGVGPSATAIDGDFFGCGVTVKHRCCNGQCSYETFALAKEKEFTPGEHPVAGDLFCEFTKTGFRPYDIGVTAVLLIAKRHLREQFVVHSDGSDPQWLDARRICQRILGYGDWFGIVEQQVEEDGPDPESATEKRQVTLRTLVEIEPSKLT